MPHRPSSGRRLLHGQTLYFTPLLVGVDARIDPQHNGRQLFVGGGVLDAPRADASIRPYASRKRSFQNQRCGLPQTGHDRCAGFAQRFRRLVAAGLQNAAHTERLRHLKIMDRIPDHHRPGRVEAFLF